MTQAHGPLGPCETELRVQFLEIALFDPTSTVDEALKLYSQIECLLRSLQRIRSARTKEFHMLSRRRDSHIWVEMVVQGASFPHAVAPTKFI